jgi:Bifunctional DNA primase/polymerase, N-terminal
VSELLEAALAYARAGLPIFPLHPRSKIPFGKPKPEEGKPGHVCAAPLHQHGHLDATTDPAVIEAWWVAHPAANIAMATGHGIDVLDIDGDEGEATLAALVARRWPLPETCEVRTGRVGGGRQLDFLGAGWPNTASKLGPKLDTKGLGGFVLRPPSVHPSDAVYTWTNLSRPAPAPAWLTALLYRPPQPVAPPFVPRVRSTDDDDIIEQASRYLDESPAAIAFQGGHNATWEAARTLRGFGLTKGEALDLLVRIYNPRCSPPWREDELRHKVEDAFSNRAKKIPDLRGRAS